jgi:hypothetical protein
VTDTISVTIEIAAGAQVSAQHCTGGRTAGSSVTAPDQPSAALARLIDALPCTDRDTVTRFAEFLAAAQARPHDRG